MNIKPINEVNRIEITKIFEENWGSPIVVTKNKCHNLLNLNGFVSVDGKVITGVITYSINGNECEIVSLNSLKENLGIGSGLVKKVIEIAEKSNCNRVWLITTNDNIDAIKFYQRKSFDMVRIYRDAILQSRVIKPEIPLIGNYNIPIKHEVEFELTLNL